MFDPVTRNNIAKTAQKLGVETATLLAVAEVESGGKTGANVKGRFEPLIRFEGHYFHRLLPKTKRHKARVAGLAHPVAGKVKNPRSQTRRWAMLERAIAIDRIAAFSSVSWGIGQVMGAHWQWLGFGSVDALVEEARSSVAGQVRLMARFIKKSGLAPKLKAHNWAGFAKGYNGPAYRKNRYDEKMARAYARHFKHEGNKGQCLQPVLKKGAHGHDVEKLQRGLSLAGYSILADGKFGQSTLDAVRHFQQDNNLVTDGIDGIKTWKCLIGKSKPDSRSPRHPVKRLFQHQARQIAKHLCRIFRL